MAFDFVIDFNMDVRKGLKTVMIFAKVEATMKKYAFNRWASDKMSLKRQLPDVRHATCRTIEYDKDLPSVSTFPFFPLYFVELCVKDTGLDKNV